MPIAATRRSLAALDVGKRLQDDFATLLDVADHGSSPLLYGAGPHGRDEIEVRMIGFYFLVGDVVTQRGAATHP